MTIRPAVLAAVTAAIVSVALMPGTAQQSPPTAGAPNPILDRTELAQHRSGSRRPLDRGQRRQRTAAGGVLRGSRRGTLEDG